MEVNRRLIPIFLHETEVNLGILSDYFFRCAQLSQTREDLKTAYRAAHTIKGTAQLVQFKGINQIAQHIEQILEKHYLLVSEITHPELEILQQVIKLLANIVAAVKKSGAEPQQLVDEALTLLVQMAPVATLANQETKLHKFSEKYPDLISLRTRVAAMKPVDDPFAEDETFHLGVASNSGLDIGNDDQPVAEQSNHFGAADPFADDPDLAVFSEPPLTPDPVSESEPAGDSKVPPLFSDKYGVDLDHGDDFMPAAPSATVLPVPLNLPERDFEPRRDYVCCAFELCGRKYHLPISYMVEISDSGPLLPLPLAPAYIKGLVNLRGQVMPVVDMSVFHPRDEAMRETWRLIVAQNKTEKIAFLAEGIPYLAEETIGEEIDLPTFIVQHRLKRLSA